MNSRVLTDVDDEIAISSMSGVIGLLVLDTVAPAASIQSVPQGLSITKRQEPSD